jgi:hypothetical protein
MLPEFVLKLLGAKKRTLIRDGKLWEITSVFGKDISTVEQAPVQAAEFRKPEPITTGELRVHVILPENNVTNHTKHPDLL